MVDSPRRHFIPWNRPLLPQAVAWLIGNWRGGSPLDLSQLLVVVPTRQSGRRLREALAGAAAERGQAVFPPRVVTPEFLLVQEARADTAPRLVSLLAWVEVFRALELEKFRDVFPVDPAARTFAWALRLARAFARLQAALAEGGLRMRDVSERAGPDFPEAERWRALGQLEEMYTARLTGAGLRDAQAVKIGTAHNPTPIAGCERIVVIATPDPLPLAIEVLANHARQLPVDVLVFAPESEGEHFDEWGRPRAAGSSTQHDQIDSWMQRVIAVPHFDERVRLCANPAAQAEAIAQIAAGYGDPVARLSIGVADAEILPLVENALGRTNVGAFNPEGRARKHDALHALLSALAAFAGNPQFDEVAALMRCPDVLDWLRSREVGNFSSAVLLAELDELRSEHLPPSLSAAENHAAGFPNARRALTALTELHRVLATGEFPTNAAAALAMIFARRRVDAAGALAESAGVWMATLREAADAFAIFSSGEMTLADSWNFVLEEFAATTRTTERLPAALDLLGWLELLWEDAPHLVVAGFNEGRVPDSITGDVFLPEALRIRLGLKTNAARFARDAYLLTALTASRADNGRLDLLLGKTSTVGDPLRPSRLLLRCADSELPARVTRLFSPAEPVRATLPWSRAWRLTPRRIAPRPRISVTGLRDWLNCPFRFYLRHVLRMARVDVSKAELDAADFGILLHDALQKLGENATLRDCTDHSVLTDFLLDRFDRTARARYGGDLTLPLIVQFESARQRLRAAAAAEANSRADGWRTERVEWPFSFPLGGLTLHGKIDRIDRHADGRVRVLDYKTGDSAKSPAQTHLRAPKAADASRPEWMRCVMAGVRERVWVDLQLPLYRQVVVEEWGHAVECGYFNLPKAVTDTSIVLWEDYSRELQVSAERCAENAARAVVAGSFWPPTELQGREAEWDDFAELFHEGAAESIDFGSGDGQLSLDGKLVHATHSRGEGAS